MVVAYGSHVVVHIGRSKARIQASARMQSPNMVAGLLIDRGESAAHDDLVVGLHGQREDGVVRICVEAVVGVLREADRRHACQCQRQQIDPTQKTEWRACIVMMIPVGLATMRNERWRWFVPCHSTNNVLAVIDESDQPLR